MHIGQEAVFLMLCQVRVHTSVHSTLRNPPTRDGLRDHPKCRIWTNLSRLPVHYTGAMHSPHLAIYL